MITDRETNFVYFSELFEKDFEKEYSQIISILDKYNIGHGLLKGTKDIWCRDYIPIQLSKDKFIEYRYDPDYLQGVQKGRRDLKTYPDIVCDLIKLNVTKTDIILDGGNVVKASQSIILTDKIVEENKRLFKRKELVEKLKQIFEVDKVILIPWDSKEEFGHADGMIRFISDKEVILHKYFDYYPTKFKEKLFGALEKNGIELVKLEFDVPKEAENKNWAYINFLQTKDLILLPMLHIDEDEQAFEKFKTIFTDYADKDRIIQVGVSELVEEGGALNCISWTIKH